MTACQTVWLENILKEMEIEVIRPIELFIDNKCAINLSRNSDLHGRSIYIEAKFHFPREQVNKGALQIVHSSSEL